MRFFLVKLNHELEDFNLNNLTSQRIDLVARCINAALWLDKNIRRDVKIIFHFKNNKVIEVDGKIKGMRPDERSIAGFIKHLLEGKKYPGIKLYESSFEELVENQEHKKVFLLDLKGKPIEEEKELKDSLFILGDDKGINLNFGAEKLSLGPKSYLTSHCIVVINNYLDKLEVGKNA